MSLQNQFVAKGGKWISALEWWGEGETLGPHCIPKPGASTMCRQHPRAASAGVSPSLAGSLDLFIGQCFLAALGPSVPIQRASGRGFCLQAGLAPPPLRPRELFSR